MTAVEEAELAYAATMPASIFAPPLFVATAPPSEATIIAVVVVLPFVPETRTVDRPLDSWTRASGAKAMIIRPASIIP
jgi:hypothetical protein